MRLRTILKTATLTFSMLLGLSSSFAQSVTFPTKAINIVVPFPPGGSVDVRARALAAHLSQELGQSVIVENKPGGNMIIAADAVARTEPDGHSLLVITNTFLTNAAVRDKLPYDTRKDFVPVLILGESGFVVWARSDFPANNIADLISLARSQPDNITYGTASTGGLTHLAPVLFEQMADIQLRHIPYKGGPPLFNDLAAGRIDIVFNGYDGGLSHLQSGRIKALGQTGGARSPNLPDIPAVSETAGMEAYDVKFHIVVYAKAGTPAPVLEKLNRALHRAVQKDATNYVNPLDYQENNVEEAAQYFDKQFNFWTDAVTRAGVSTDQ